MEEENNDETNTNFDYTIITGNNPQGERIVINRRFTNFNLPSVPSTIRRITSRRTRRMSVSTSSDEGETRTFEYIDFRNYPLSLDWNDVENDETIAYEILNAYGHVGLNLYTKFKNLHLTDMSTSEKFLIRLLEAYNDRLENKNIDGTSISDFVELLPSLSKIGEILHRHLFSANDLLALKLIIDMYEVYYSTYDYPLYENLLSHVIPIAKLFYLSISEENLEKIYTTIRTKYKKFIKDKVNFRMKEKYLKHYTTLSIEIKKLAQGSKLNNFIH